MASQDALFFHRQVARENEYNGLVLDDTEAERIARRLAGHSVLFLADHGVTVTVRQAFRIAGERQQSELHLAALRRGFGLD
jgi:hypothetical protein